MPRLRAHDLADETIHCSGEGARREYTGSECALTDLSSMTLRNQQNVSDRKWLIYIERYSIAYSKIAGHASYRRWSAASQSLGCRVFISNRRQRPTPGPVFAPPLDILPSTLSHEPRRLRRPTSTTKQALDHTMPAIIGQKAPAFKGQAVVDGVIKEISIDDYKGALPVVGVAVAPAVVGSGRCLLCGAPMTLPSWGFASSGEDVVSSGGWCVE